MLWSGWIGLETWHYSYFRKAAWWWWLPEWLAGNFVYSDVRNSVCYMGYLQWSAWSTHCNLVILVRNRTIRAYVVVVLNVPSWLSGVLCYRGYKPAHAQQAPLWGGALKAGLQHSREEEGGAWELYHSNSLAKSTFLSKLIISFPPSLDFWVKMSKND